MEYQLRRGEEQLDKYGNKVVRYTALYLLPDNERHYLGHIFVPVEREKSILMELYQKAPRMKINLERFE